VQCLHGAINLLRFSFHFIDFVLLLAKDLECSMWGMSDEWDNETSAGGSTTKCPRSNMGGMPTEKKHNRAVILNLPRGL
jgi:hypothetical protein